MSKSDQWVNIILVMLMLLYLSVWVFGYYSNKLSVAITCLNFIAALSIVAYWVVRQMKITQHFIEPREIIVLGFEVLIICCALYAIINGYRNSAIKIMQYVCFGIHGLLLILSLIFMLTFKINKLM